VRVGRIEYGNVSMSVPIDLEGLSGEPPDMQFGYDQTVQALTAAHQTARDELNATLIVLVLPTKEEVYSNRVSPPLNADLLDELSHPRLRLLDDCLSRGWLCVDLYPALRDKADHAEQVYYPTMPNLNPAGQRVVAQVVAETLSARGLVASSFTR